MAPPHLLSCVRLRYNEYYGDDIILCVLAFVCVCVCERERERFVCEGCDSIKVFWLGRGCFLFSPVRGPEPVKCGWPDFV